MKRINGSFLGHLSPVLTVLAFLQVVAATWAQSAQPSSGPPKLSNAPAVATVNGRLRWPFFIYFYRFTPIADTQGGFPFQSILGAPTINSDAVIAYPPSLPAVMKEFLRARTLGMSLLWLMRHLQVTTLDSPFHLR